MEGSNRRANDSFTLIAGTSLLRTKSNNAHLELVIMLIMKSGTALVLACMSPRPPAFMLRCVMRVAYVGSVSCSDMFSSILKNVVVILSKPSVR